MDNYKKRVLIVDDDEEIATVIVSALSAGGCQCDSAADGAQALEMALAHEYDAVVSDVVMPGMSGLQLASELARRRSGLPVMVMTGYGDSHAAAEALAAGASEFIAKPFTLDEFDIRFRKMLQHAELLRRNRERQNELHKISASMISCVFR